MKLATSFTVVFSAAILREPSNPAAPGAGQSPITVDHADAQVRKDGFFHVKCMHEGMQLFSDNQSAQGQKRYAAGLSDVSVIWYHETVATEDQRTMTPRECFNFCRVQDRIGFFGLIHGRDCYCTPYFRPEAGGENEDCDLPCPGDQTTMCGGKHKSDMYAMHYCNDADKDFDKAKSDAKEVVDNITALEEFAECKAEMQGLGEGAQLVAGMSGAAAESSAIQAAKVRAGELERLLEEVKRMKEEFDTVSQASTSASAVEQQQYKEAQVFELQNFRNRAEEFYGQAAKELGEACKAPAAPQGYDLKNEYRDVSYYGKHRDGEFDYTTCEGSAIGGPRYLQATECALACRATIFPAKCEGFSLFGQGADTKGLCYLYSKVKASHLYGNCDPSSFLQTEKADGYAQCFYRLSDSKGFLPEATLHTNYCK